MSAAIIKDAINLYISSNKDASLSDVVNEMIPRFYPLNDPDSKISFDLVLDAARYYTTIIERDDMCVEQSMLYKYKVLSLQKNKSGDYVELKQDVKNMLEQCKRLVSGIDYITRNVPCNKNVGPKPKQYVMTPDAFFMCLIRSKNSSIYAEYYCHVLKIYNYCEKYFNGIYKEQIKDLEEEMDSLNDEITIQEETISAIESEKVTLVSEKTTLTADKLSLTEQLAQMEQRLQSQLSALQSGMSAMQSTLDRIERKLPSCVNEPPKNNLNDQFIVMQLKDENDYYVIRRQKRSVASAIKLKQKEGYTVVYGIYGKEYVPNSIHLWNSVKDVLGGDKQISFNDTTKNNLVLNIPRDEFFDIIKEVFDKRKKY